MEAGAQFRISVGKTRASINLNRCLRVLVLDWGSRNICDVNSHLRLCIGNMSHQFRNQWTSLGGGNAENTPLNNTMSNHFQTNLGIGPLGLIQQCQPYQYSMFLPNALADQTSLLRAQQAASQFNWFSLPNQFPLLGQTAAQRGVQQEHAGPSSRRGMFRIINSNKNQPHCRGCMEEARDRQAR